MPDKPASSLGIAVRKLDSDFVVRAPQWKTCGFDPVRLGRKCIKTALAQAKLPALARSRTHFDVAVVLTNDKDIHGINLQWRGFDKPTNVISFAALDGMMAQDVKLIPPKTPLPLGDIIVSYQTLKRESSAQGKELKAHYAHLMVHGLLHLLQYDHINDKDARQMEKLERRILHTLGFDDPYAYGTLIED